MKETMASKINDTDNGNQEATCNDNIGMSTLDSDTFACTVKEVHSSRSFTKSVELVSPPFVEWTTFNQQTKMGTKSVCTPK